MTVTLSVHAPGLGVSVDAYFLKASGCAIPLLRVMAYEKTQYLKLSHISTHPDIAALVTPLYAARKEGILIYIFSYPLYPKDREGGPAKRRPGESSIQLVISGTSLLWAMYSLSRRDF